MSKTPTLRVTFVARNASTNGPRKAEDWRNSQREIQVDLSNIVSNWNTYIVPLVQKLPDGTGTTAQKEDDFGGSLNAFTQGLDGSQLYIDWDTTASEESGLFWNSSRNRPYTIKEITKKLKDIIDDTETSLVALINQNSSGLTTAEKSAIGDSIFGTGSSSPSSLDGRTTTNTNNITYLKRDIYDDASHDLSAALTNSVKDIFNKLLSLHGVSDWQGSIASASHSAIDIDTLSGDLDPDKVRATVTDHSGDSGYPDNYSSIGSSLDQELGRIKTIIRNLKGLSATHWEDTVSSTLPKNTSGYAQNIYEILNDVSGTGTKSKNNPWGYKGENIDELYTDVVDTATSGIYNTDNNQPYSSLQDNLDWMCDPADSGVDSYNTFRRKEVSFTVADSGTYTITHNRGAWPLVQVFESNYTVYSTNDYVHNTDVTIVQHDDNTVQIYNGSGHTISSGIAILLW